MRPGLRRTSPEINSPESIVTEAGEPVVLENEYTLTVGGGQLGADAPQVARTFHVKSTVTLPE